jgi:dTDP-4-amino-4,6-dideoxygalactose transaminase
LIQYDRQAVSKSDFKLIKKALDSELLTISPAVEAFETEISSLVGNETFVVTSGTAALHCAYAAIDI